MFKVLDKVIDKKGRAFYINEVVSKDFGNGPKDYFILLPCFKEDYNENYLSFIPVSNASNLIRPIMNKKEALNLIDSLNDIEGYGEIPPKNRKSYFEDVLSKGKEYETCRVIKSLFDYREEKAKIRKTLSEYENKLLNYLNKIMKEELSLSLGIEIDEVCEFVENKLTFPFFF